MVSSVWSLEGSTDVYRVSTTAFLAFVLSLRTDVRRRGGSILRLCVCVRFLHGSILDAWSLTCRLLFKEQFVASKCCTSCPDYPSLVRARNREIPPHHARFGLFEVPVEAYGASRQRKARVIVVCAVRDPGARDMTGNWMAVHVLARIMACHREMAKPDALPTKMQAAGRSETRIPELHSAYAGRLSRIGSGDREMVDIKCFVVSQVSLANQKTLDGEQTKQNARVPPHRMQASVNASNGCTANVSRTGRQRLGVIAGLSVQLQPPCSPARGTHARLVGIGILFCSQFSSAPVHHSQ